MMGPFNAVPTVLHAAVRSGRQILRGKTTRLGRFLILGYWPVVRYAPNGPQTEFLRIARTVVAIAISVSFLPGIVKALKTPWPTYGGQLVLGIVLSWTGVAGSAAGCRSWAARSTSRRTRASRTRCRSRTGSASGSLSPSGG